MHNFDKHFEETQKTIRRSQAYVFGAMIAFALVWVSVISVVLGFLGWVVVMLFRHFQVI